MKDGVAKVRLWFVGSNATGYEDGLRRLRRRMRRKK